MGHYRPLRPILVLILIVTLASCISPVAAICRCECGGITFGEVGNGDCTVDACRTQHTGWGCHGPWTAHYFPLARIIGATLGSLEALLIFLRTASCIYVRHFKALAQIRFDLELRASAGCANAPTVEGRSSVVKSAVMTREESDYPLFARDISSVGTTLDRIS
ncbi:hypothetical protein DFS34DRAFT_273208 [Phlyctochytrium arcticum]|nr:hypothetical protein DFS34DRAFT_273208 [Phlyctochytrium arcticum]